MEWSNFMGFWKSYTLTICTPLIVHTKILPPPQNFSIWALHIYDYIIYEQIRTCETVPTIFNMSFILDLFFFTE